MPLGQLPLQLGAAHRPLGEQVGRLGDHRGDVLPAQPLAPGGAGERPVEHRLQQRPQRQRVGRGDGVDRRPHQLGPDDGPRRHEAVELGRVVVRQPVPQREVRHPRHLRLQPDQVLQRRRHRHGDPVQQQLPGEGGPAQRAAAQDVGQSWMPRVSAPSTTRCVPVVRLDTGLDRKTTAFAESSGVPMRPVGFSPMANV